ncbi:MAG: hypothetical protein RLY20_3323 [Verrucomicrobiota bacterium]
MHRMLQMLTCVAFATVMMPFGAGAEDLLTCGWTEVRAYRVEGTNATVLWSWGATNANLPEEFKPLFNTTDECKPCPGGKLLVTSSGGDTADGAVALVQPGTSNVFFYAHAPNGHSAELLPSNRVAVALSYKTNGNRLVVFDLAEPDVEKVSVPLWGAHGVVWDEQRQLIWGLSDSFIAAFALQNWNTTNPSLVQVSWTGLLEGGGHDMYPVPNSPYMIVATETQCWLFHRDTRYFTKHPLIGDVATVKSTSVHPVTGRIAYIVADTVWWSETLRFALPSGTITLPGEHFYRARWTPAEVPALAITQTPTNTTKVSWRSKWTDYSLQENVGFSAAGWGTPA